MNKEILEFLDKSRISVLTTTLKDGSLHGAALHFSHNYQPLEFYVSTDKTSRKCEALVDGSTVKAAMVIGFSEDEWITLQMDGEVTAILDNQELGKAQAIHYKKYPGSEKYKNDPSTIFLKFTPKWWRYTDFNTEPATIFSSDK